MLNLDFNDHAAIVPQGYLDAIGSGINPHGNVDTMTRADGFHPSAPDKYYPSWKFVPPPGVGDAPQHVFSTFCLTPQDIRGPGDNPVTFLRTVQPPLWQNFAMRFNGMPVNGGGPQFTGLYAPSPQNSPANAPY
jgi:hypothetical protein